MKLAFKKMGKGDPLLILHGLFGSSDNWQTVGKKLADQFEVYLVDQRNHGHSPHSEEMSYDYMAKDLEELFVNEGIGRAWVLGHSMGGKTAMRFAQLFPERVRKLIVVDIGVKAYEPHHDSILDAFKAIDPSVLESRSDAEAILEPKIPDFGVRQFILKNLYRKDKESYAWRVNFKVLESKMENILSAIPHKIVDVETLFVNGTKSDYIKRDDEAAIKEIFPKAEFAELPTGHWVHAEDPEGIIEILQEFVTS